MLNSRWPQRQDNSGSSLVVISTLKHSITRTKSMGERRSPCLSPRLWQILRPGVPLRRTFVLSVESRAESNPSKSSGNKSQREDPRGRPTRPSQMLSSGQSLVRLVGSAKMWEPSPSQGRNKSCLEFGDLWWKRFGLAKQGEPQNG